MNNFKAPIVTRPSKQDVRDWMISQRSKREVPPTLEEIRTELGWKMIKANDKSR